MKPKLHIWHTIAVGAAFLAITAFWQMYNNVNPLVLTNTFHLNKTITGTIMAADNVFAIFLLPLFGALSDKTKTPFGKRKPYILVGTILSVILMLQLPVLADSYFSTPAQWKIVFYVVVLALLLISMGSFRTPAVSLMPDVTAKKYRSIGNAIINLMGSVGGIFYLILTAIFYSESRTAGMAHVSYFLLFAIVAFLMIAALVVVMILVKEPKWAKQAEEEDLILDRLEAEENAKKAASKEESNGSETKETDKSAKEKDTKKAWPKMVSLIFLLLSVSLWFISYNAIETWFTEYAYETWHMALGSSSLCLTIATATAILCFIPLGLLASVIGRKKSIFIGIGLLFVNFFICFAYTLYFDHFNPILYAVFSFVGIGWAMINVNSLPMVVEMCKNSDIGKYTGLYYTFSMAAQIVTPVLAGWLMENIGNHMLFLYSMVFAALAFITMLFVHHCDHKSEAKTGIDAYEEMDG